MGRRPKSGVLKAAYNGHIVGKLSKEPGGAIFWHYSEEWLNNDEAFPISLSLPLTDSRYTGEPVSAVFDNLLPDNDAIRRTLAERVGARSRDLFSLLEALGRDCVGALQFLPEDADTTTSGAIEGEEVSDGAVAKLLRNLRSAPLGVSRNQDFRISVAGAQEKTALLYWKQKWHLPSGTTATTHILKPQIGMLSDGVDFSHSVENEHFCMRFLAHLGLPIAQTTIVDFENVRTLCVERFDRIWLDDQTRLMRRPQEDCLQALGVPSAFKYQSDGGPGAVDLLKLLAGSDHAERDQYHFFKAQICYFLLSLTDGYAKNFSLFLGSNGRYIMTPLYDGISTEPNYAGRQVSKNQMKMAMCFGKHRRYRMDSIGLRHFKETAELGKVPATLVEQIIEDVKEQWESAAEAAVSELESVDCGSMFEIIVNGFSKRLRGLL